MRWIPYSYTDLSKAFNQVNIKRLILKSNYMGIGSPLLESWLTGRKQFVKINAIKSNGRFIKCSSRFPSRPNIVLFLIM